MDIINCYCGFEIVKDKINHCLNCESRFSFDLNGNLILYYIYCDINILNKRCVGLFSKFTPSKETRAHFHKYEDMIEIFDFFLIDINNVKSSVDSLIERLIKLSILL